MMREQMKWLKGFMTMVCVWSLFVFTACVDGSHREYVNALNDKSYYFHYRNIDSTLYYAEKALEESESYETGKAAALNNIAFCDIVKMDFASADSLLNEVRNTTDNEVELLVADVQQMRICQRRSENKDYYVFQNSAQNRLDRIKESIEDEEFRDINPYLKKRIAYAESEFYIVSSTYYYYVGLEDKSREAILSINADELIQIDSAQVADYLYNIGAGGILKGDSKDIKEAEADYLLKCEYIARKCGYVFWLANALQAMAEQHVAEDIDLAIDEAKQSLKLFTQYGDVYQIAGAYRTLANCYWAKGDYDAALGNLKSALNANNRIDYAPELVASIHERLCVLYSAMDNKRESDLNRNFYLDLQDGTRQDRYLENRADELEKSEQQLNVMLVAVICSIVILIILLIFFYKMKKRREDNFDINELLKPLQKWRDNNRLQLQHLDDLYEETEEKCNVERVKYIANLRKDIESRAKISLVNSVVPFIDRMMLEVQKEESDLTYVAELTDKINEYNILLTDWIQMRQGELSIKVETFSLKSLFDVVSKAKAACQIKGVKLVVDDTTETIKADRTLTLFMLNTLVDNARKYTQRNGKIHVYAKPIDDCVEISVADTGAGMDEKQLAAVFDHKISDISASASDKGFGFGLMNCKGIIEKYKKVSSLFRNVMIAAESKVGEGSRFYFRLPKGKQLLVLFALMLSALACPAASNVNRYADSAYQKNVAGDYESALLYADSCIASGCKDSNSLLMAYNEAAVAALALHEWDVYRTNNRKYIQLFKEMSTDSSLPTYCSDMQKSQSNKNIAIILLVILFLSIIPAYYFLFYRHRIFYSLCIDRIRQINEVLMKDIKAEEKIEAIKPLAKGEFPQALKKVVEQILQALHDSQANIEKKQNYIEMAEDEFRRVEMENATLHICNNVLDNCLSTLKHETMYYPNRIRQLVDINDKEQLKEMIVYYKELYTILESQAMRQVEKFRLNPTKVERFGHHFLGNKLQLEYLFELLGITNNDERLSIDNSMPQYLRLTLKRHDIKLKGDEYKQFFSPEGRNVAMLICRQIVRDHSQFTHRHGCGIYAQDNSGTEIIITLPSANQPAADC